MQRPPQISIGKNSFKRPALIRNNHTPEPFFRKFSEHFTGALRARDYIVAVNLARSEMEQLDILNDFCHANLNVNSPTGTTTDPYQGYPYALTRTVWCQTGDCASNCASPANANNGIKRIEITVKKSGSTDTIASLLSYRTKYVLFGQ